MLRRVCIAQSSAGCLLGEVTISECIAVAARDSSGGICPVDDTEESAANFLLKPCNMQKHQITDMSEFDHYGQFYAWVLTHPVAYPQPVPYNWKKGAVVFVNITGRVPMDFPDKAPSSFFLDIWF